MESYIKYVKTLTEAGEHHVCHLSKGPLCMYAKLEELSEDYLQAYVAYERLIRWNLYYDNPDYIKKVVN